MLLGWCKSFQYFYSFIQIHSLIIQLSIIIPLEAKEIVIFQWNGVFYENSFSLILCIT